VTEERKPIGERLAPKSPARPKPEAETDEQTSARTGIRVGFEYDQLTLADAAAVELVRDRLYACPCGDGVWVSVRTGMIYRGHGGNERAQWELQRDAPWVRLERDEVYDKFVREIAESRDAVRVELTRVTNALRQLVSGIDA
jgi:hypothetical protein